MSGESEIEILIIIYSLFGSRLSNHSIIPEKAIKKIIKRYYERAPQTAPDTPYLLTQMQMSLSKSHKVFDDPWALITCTGRNRHQSTEVHTTIWLGGESSEPYTYRFTPHGFGVYYRPPPCEMW